MLEVPAREARVRWGRLAWVGAGASATLLAVDAAAFLLFVLWTTTWSGRDRACEPVTIGDCIAPADLTVVATGALAAVMGLGVLVGLGTIAATVAVAGGATRWWPRRASGTAFALGLGLLTSVAAPVLALLLVSGLAATWAVA
ncbi:hypothetical protein [Phytohabitans kaempferiae]|uniref:Uncharacterized protein n=1 Tax=Phytohabitans kaempferiae TaxID=1620943 RepID=A0ABV6LYF6_9ACTN